MQLGEILTSDVRVQSVGSHAVSAIQVKPDMLANLV